MIENLKHIEKLNKDLDKMEKEQLDRLYLKVFNTDDGKLLLQDLRNRCFVDSTTESDSQRTFINEGARSVYLMIQTRISDAVNGAKKEE